VALPLLLGTALARIHLKTAAIVAAIAIPLATSCALALPGDANAQTPGGSAPVGSCGSIYGCPGPSGGTPYGGPASPTSAQLTCASGLAALGYVPNAYASPDQQQQDVQRFLALVQRINNEMIDGYFANAPAGTPRSFAALPFNMRQLVNLAVATSQACGVQVTPPASLTPASPSYSPPPPMPAPQVSPNDSYSTANGVKTSTDMQDELLHAGYAGPFDVPSLLAAYQRTTASPVRPL
jgi:hypothetical protein